MSLLSAIEGAGAVLADDAKKIVAAIDLGTSIPWSSLASSVTEAVTNQKAALTDGTDQSLIYSAADVLKIIALADPPVAIAANYVEAAGDVLPYVAPGIEALIGLFSGSGKISFGTLADNAGERQEAIVEDRFEKPFTVTKESPQ